MTKESSKERIKVTDRRIFTADGEIREEYRHEVEPSIADLRPVAASEPTPEAGQTLSPEPQLPSPPETPKAPEESGADRRKQPAGSGDPQTPFTSFIESLVMQAYMSLGMLRNPYSGQPAVDVSAARQMIDIIALLRDKTHGNLTPGEAEFLSTHLGELKLAYVQRTKAI